MTSNLGEKLAGNSRRETLEATGKICHLNSKPSPRQIGKGLAQIFAQQVLMTSNLRFFLAPGANHYSIGL
jgi:hypothetical protein